MSFLLKDTHKISHVSGPRAKAVTWYEPQSDLPSGLGESPWEAEGDCILPWGHGHWWQPFWELLLSYAHWQAPLQNLPSSLWVLGPNCVLAQQPTGDCWRHLKVSNPPDEDRATSISRHVALRAHSCLWPWPYPPKDSVPHSTYQWVGTSSRNSWSPALPSEKTALASGSASLQQGADTKCKKTAILQPTDRLTPKAPSQQPWVQLGHGLAH